MQVLLSALRWTPPLVVPAILLAFCAATGVDLDSALPWTFGNKVWRLGNSGVLSRSTRRCAVSRGDHCAWPGWVS